MSQTPYAIRWCSALLAAAAALPAPLLAASDPVVFSFAFVGCNRMGKGGTGLHPDWISTANEAQLLRTFQDVAALQPRPQLMVLAGDIVKAKKAGTTDLAAQLQAWQKLVPGPLGKQIRLVAFTGNHELLMDAPAQAQAASAPVAGPAASAAAADDDDDATEVPNPPAYGYWQKAMRGYIAGKDGPGKGGDDGLSDDEKRLSYTFQVGDVRFIVLNTDSLRDKTSIGVVPLAWLRKQLTLAQQDRKVAHVFVMGHKPAAVPDGKTVVDPTGADTIRKDQAQDFYRALNAPGGSGPSKVRAYLAAHSHQWNYARDLSAQFGDGKVPQIIAGNGGSPPASMWKSADAYYGYTLVQVTRSGQVTARSYGRKIPGAQGASTKHPAEPATPRGDVIVLSP